MQEFPGSLAVKDLVVFLQWLGFDPWLGNFCMLWVQPKNNKQKTKKREGEKQNKTKTIRRVLPFFSHLP